MGIGLVPYSPLGRGFLTGSIKSRDDLEEGDWRLNNPQFSEGNFHHNLALVDNINQLAEAKKCTFAQLTLAWILHQGEDYVPTPGTRSVKQLIENAGATSIVLSPVERDQINQLIPSDLVFGERYPEATMSSLKK